MATNVAEQVNQTSGGSDLRACIRARVSCRSAIWFNEGPEQGILGTLSDLSMSGFSVRILTTVPEAFTLGAMVFCVLHIDQAHFDVVAKIVSLRDSVESGVRIGFSIEVLSQDSGRLLSGVLHFLEERTSHEEASKCPQDPEIDCDRRRCILLERDNP